MRLAFGFSYIGTGFFGSQQQSDKRTVVGEIIKALSELNLITDISGADIAVSGRTDRGVHAKRQVIAFNTDYPERAISAINKKLPPDIRFTGCCEVPDDFNPRFSAKKRTYRYYFPTGIPGIDYNAGDMEKASLLFEGEHNFARFSRPDGKDPVREIISSKIFRDEGFLVYEISGYSFLWNMVRCIAYSLEQVGRGFLTPADISAALNEPSGRRFPAAPPEGLILWDVDCGIEFSPVNIHEKSRLFTNDKLRCCSQLKKIAEIW